MRRLIHPIHLTHTKHHSSHLTLCQKDTGLRQLTVFLISKYCFRISLTLNSLVDVSLRGRLPGAMPHKHTVSIPTLPAAQEAQVQSQPVSLRQNTFKVLSGADALNRFSPEQLAEAAAVR